MAFSATTLSANVGASDTYFGVASATGITAPVSTTGSGFTYLLVEDELMFVTAITGTVVSVNRGQFGTAAIAHSSSAPVTIGSPSDFIGFDPTIVSVKVGAPLNSGWSAPVAIPSGGAITASGPRFHTTGTNALVTLTAYSGYLQGSVIWISFDGSSTGLTWTSAGNIAVAGTATTAKSVVGFIYDEGTAKWYPTRLA